MPSRVPALLALVLVLVLGPGLAGCGGSEVEPAPAGGAARGEELLRDYGCGGCHAIPGLAQADGRVGPALADFSEQRYIAGQLPNTVENATAWIEDPKRFDPQTVMPDLGVTAEEARAIAAYLYCCT